MWEDWGEELRFAIGLIQCPLFFLKIKFDKGIKCVCFLIRLWLGHRDAHIEELIPGTWPRHNGLKFCL